jgi:hypothetical protein
VCDGGVGEFEGNTIACRNTDRNGKVTLRRRQVGWRDLNNLVDALVLRMQDGPVVVVRLTCTSALMLCRDVVVGRSNSALMSHSRAGPAKLPRP